MMDDSSAKTYEKIWLTNFFHSFPHLDMHMKSISSKFEPEEREYIESLAFWALVPVAVCLILWLFFIVYFIWRCCVTETKTKQSYSVCPRITTGLFIFFCLGLLAFGLYENEEAHRGINNFQDGIVDINSTVGNALGRINKLHGMAGDVSGKLSKSIIDVAITFNDTAQETRVSLLVKQIKRQAKNAQTQIDGVSLDKEFSYLDDVITYTDRIETYRWMVSVIISCWYMFIFFLTLIGLLIRSKDLLILSTILCVFSMILLWAFTGVELASSVGLGDFCNDPDSFVISLTKNAAEKEIVKEYVECVNNTEPFGNEIQRASKSLTRAQISLEAISSVLTPDEAKLMKKPVGNMQSEIKQAIANLSILLDNVGLCDNLHNSYEDAVDGACIVTITSTAWLSLVMTVVGLFSVILTLSNSALWRQYARNKQQLTTRQVDDTDPFLPHPPSYESEYGAVGYSSPTPWSERGTLQRYTESPYSDESLMMLPNNQRHSAPLPVDESPPPAYYPGRFVRQYAASENR